jgi:hypothetical protein
MHAGTRRGSPPGPDKPACRLLRSAASSAGCRLAPLPVQNEKLWGFAGADRSLVQVFSNDTVALKIVGIEGPRIWSHEATGYGLYGATMRVSGVVGAITAFYVRAGPRARGQLRPASPCCRLRPAAAAAGVAACRR